MANGVNGDNSFNDFQSLIKKLGQISGQEEKIEKQELQKEDITSIFSSAKDSNNNGKIDVGEFFNEATKDFDIQVDFTKINDYQALIDEYDGDIFDEMAAGLTLDEPQKADDTSGNDKTENGKNADEAGKTDETAGNDKTENGKNADKTSDAVLGDAETSLTFNNGSNVEINLRDDLTENAKIDGDATTGKFSISFGKVSKVDDTKASDDTNKAEENPETKEAEEKAAEQEKINAEKIANAFNYEKTDAPQNGTSLQAAGIIDKPLNYTFNIPDKGEPGSKSEGVGDYGTGRKDNYVAEYGDDGKLAKITTSSTDNPDTVLEEVNYTYGDDGSYTETLHDKGTGCVIETTYNPDGTIKSHNEYMSEDDKNDENPSAAREYSYSVDENGNPVQTMKNNIGVTETTTYNIADNTYTQYNDYTNSDTVLKGEVSEEAAAEEAATEEPVAKEAAAEEAATEEPVAEEADAEEAVTGDKTDYVYTNADGKEVKINVPDGWTDMVESGDKIKFTYPDGSVRTVSISASDDDKKAEDPATNEDTGNKYSVPDGEKPEYVVNANGKEISIDIPDELRDEIQTVINTKTGEVSFKDKQGNEIKPEDINALVKAAEVDKTEKTEKVDDEEEVDKTASLFKNDDRIKTDEKGNKYAEVTDWNNDRSQNNCLFRIIEHSYDLSQMNIPKRADNPNEYDWESKQYLALEKAIMDANPDIYGTEDGKTQGRTRIIDGSRHNSLLKPGDKIVLPEAYDIEELGLERPKVKKEEEKKADDKKADDKKADDKKVDDKKVDVSNSKAEVAIDNKNGQVVIDVDDDYFNSSKDNLKVKGDADEDEITIDSFKDDAKETVSFDDYKKQAEDVLSKAYNTELISNLKNTVQNDEHLSQTQKDLIMSMLSDEE